MVNISYNTLLFQFLSNPKDPNALEGVAIVFDGPEKFHETIDDPSLNITKNSILIHLWEILDILLVRFG